MTRYFDVSFAAIMLGASLALLVLGVARLFAANAGANQAGHLRRELAPPAWRHAWVLIRALAPLLQPLVGAGFAVRLQARLREAGLEQALTPAQFVAGRVLLALLGALLGVVLGWFSDVGFFVVALTAVVAFYLPSTRLRDRILRRRRKISRDLPVVLDLITMAVQGGTTIGVAIALAVERGPAGPLRDEFARVLREVKAGRPRHEAMISMADRYPIMGLRHAISAMVNAEKQGANLARVLNSQAAQRREERFLEAERMAMQAPVKLIFPLVCFIFPGTFAILLFPVVMQLMQEGLL